MSEGDKDGHAYGHATDACCDVIATSVEITEDGRVKCGTGIHVATEYRDSLTLRPNSRITKMGYVIPNSPCTGDESYRGEFFVVFRSIITNANLLKLVMLLVNLRFLIIDKFVLKQLRTLKTLA